MRRRGFTLIEVVIVIAIMLVVTAPFLDMVSMLYAHQRSLSMQADLKAEAETAAYRIFRRGAYVVDEDNHGLRFGDGSRVRWEGERLVLVEGGVERPLVSHRVVEFNAVRRGAVLTLNLALRAPSRAGGTAVEWRYQYDHPRIGEAR